MTGNESPVLDHVIYTVFSRDSLGVAILNYTLVLPNDNYTGNGSIIILLSKTVGVNVNDCNDFSLFSIVIKIGFEKVPTSN